MTAREIRERIIGVVAKNGGHLASSLGAVEIAMALAEEFDPAVDRIVWDVGHQAYAWKILTGRDAAFDTLRTAGGISGFPNPAESSCDAAVGGHAGVALSVAEGYAAARRLTGEPYHVVAVTGDASLVNGTSLEAMNNCALAGKVILVLNDNGMSISKANGNFSRLLGSIIAGARYNRVKNLVRRAGRALKLDFMHGAAHWFKGRVKSLFLADTFFEQFGMRYLGPVDGHNVDALRAAFAVAKDEKRSVIVHVVTKKGKGFAPAEEDPTAWHGVGPFALGPSRSAAAPAAPRAGEAQSWSDVFGGAVAAAARRDGRVVALTAGMKDGTGLGAFASEFPASFFDSGIAEGHMVAFAAGLAAGGLRPVVAVYSTFLQRAIDHVMHDVCISSLPVVFCVDRAGAVGADGVTHQGLYDIAMLRCLPNITICQPKDACDLEELLAEALARGGPTAIRYPRGRTRRSIFARPAQGAQSAAGASRLSGLYGEGAAHGKPRVAIWATGDWLGKAVEIADAVGGVAVHARYIKPYDAALLARQRAAGMKIASLENGAVAGGLGEAIGADFKFGWPDEFIAHGTQAEQEKRCGLDAMAVIGHLRAALDGTGAGGADGI